MVKVRPSAAIATRDISPDRQRGSIANTRVDDYGITRSIHGSQRALQLVGLRLHNVTARPYLQMQVMLSNGRLPRWPPFAKGSLSGSWIGFWALLGLQGYYRALARSATIPGDRPVRPDFEKP
jgi:hypothetical protein